MKRRTKIVLRLVAALLIGLLGAVFLLFRAVSARGNATGHGYIRLDAPADRLTVLKEAERRGFVKSAAGLDLFARLTGRSATLGIGTYRLAGASSGVGNLRGLYRPVVQRLRLPETNWARRTANVLEKHEVCTADDYMAEVRHPSSRKTDFPLPEATLEGYLYPDTYDLPPLLGAKAVVGRQLAAFKAKVWEPLDHPKDLERILTLASLVQLEAGRDDERPIIAGVIENRLARHMRLQIDASLLYGMGKWRRLYFRDYREFDSPYNLYRHEGLPPTPICSPSIASIRAAMAPARHNDLYYVAMPDGHSLFAATYPEHLRNIERRKTALKRR